MTVDTLAHEKHNQGVGEMQEEEEKLVTTSPIMFTVENGTVMIDSGVSSLEEFSNLNLQVKIKLSLMLLWIRLHQYFCK